VSLESQAALLQLMTVGADPHGTPTDGPDTGLERRYLALVDSWSAKALVDGPYREPETLVQGTNLWAKMAAITARSASRSGLLQIGGAAWHRSFRTSVMGLAHRFTIRRPSSLGADPSREMPER
jgi:hypothetical protein